MKTANFPTTATLPKDPIENPHHPALEETTTKTSAKTIGEDQTTAKMEVARIKAQFATDLSADKEDPSALANPQDERKGMMISRHETNVRVPL